VNAGAGAIAMPIPNLGAILSSSLQIGGNRQETAVAHAYLIAHQNDFDRVEFNVGLGPGITLWPGAEPWLQKAATASSKPRADMIGYRGDTATLVEFKGRIGPSALGQLLTYSHILRQDNPKLLQVYKVAAGNSVQEGLPQLWQQYGVSVELYPGAQPPPTTTS
jgi:hypothetical protein